MAVTQVAAETERMTVAEEEEVTFQEEVAQLLSAYLQANLTEDRSVEGFVAFINDSKEG